MKAIPSWPKLVVLVVAVVVGLTACDDGPADVVEVLDGTADGAGVILTFDVVVDGPLPEGTPLDGLGLRVSVSARDASTGLFSPGRVVDELGFAFDNATVRRPGPFGCNESGCRARLYGFVPGVTGDTLEYSISADYAPDWDGSSPPDFRIDLVEAREAPVRELFYTVPVGETNELVGAVVQLAATDPVVDPPLGWFGVPSAEIWQPSDASPAFACLADGCAEDLEVVFANDVGGAPALGPTRVEGWFAAEADPVLTVTNQTRRDGAVTETSTSVVDEYRVTIEYPSRDPGLPLMVDLMWTSDEFDQFFIDDDYAANRLRATAILAGRCRGTYCSFRVGRIEPSPNGSPSSELTVTVLPWESETDPDILISITDCNAGGELCTQPDSLETQD